MCLGIPGKVVDIYEVGGLKMGKVDFGGATREACLAHVPDVQVGEYVLIHVGFAISRLSPEEAQESLALWDELTKLDGETGVERRES